MSVPNNPAIFNKGGGGGGSSSSQSQYLQSTREGIRDTRTGEIIASANTSIIEANRLAAQAYATYTTRQAQAAAEQRKAEAERQRLQQLEKEAKVKALEQKKYNELIALRQAEQRRQIAEFKTLPKEERVALRKESYNEARVNYLEKNYGRNIKLTEELERTRERLRSEERAREITSIKWEGINPQTGKPYGSYSVPPTIKEQFKESRQQQGQIVGTLSFVGGKAGAFAEEVALGSWWRRGTRRGASSTTVRLASRGTSST